MYSDIQPFAFKMSFTSMLNKLINGIKH